MVFFNCTFKCRILTMTILSIMAAMTSQNSLALENVDDNTLGNITGEGIAILPQNFALSFNTPDVATDDGGGYIRFIPVGPLSATATAKGYQKADGWLYGLSVSQSNKNLGVTLDSTDWGSMMGRPIDSWGTAKNPWVAYAKTSIVPDFTGNTTNSNVTYLTLEAPFYDTTLPVTATPASSAYNLKLGLWADFFKRDPSVAESGYAGLDLTNRLRLAAVWDGFSINGTNLKVFQTLGGVKASDGGQYTALLKINGVPNQSRTFNYGMSTSYNQTLGLAGLLRLNSRPTDTVRGAVSNQTVTRQIIQMNYAPATNWDTTSATFGGTYSEGTVLATATGALGSPVANINTTETVANGTEGITTTYIPMTNSSYRGDTPPIYSAGPPEVPGYKQSFPGAFVNGGLCTNADDSNAQIRDGSLQFGQCLTQESFTTRRFKASGTNTWTPPAFQSVLRLSTQEKTDSGTGTPALGGTLPNFAPNTNAEGIFLYDVNINLVLGSLYQPLMLSTDGNNFAIELARIPNVSAIYNQVYTDYSNPASATYKGSTCNIYQCGTNGITGFQGNNATHSSITIGSTIYNASANTLEADQTVGAYGVSVGELKTGNNLPSQTVQDYTQVWQETRSWDCARNGFGNCKIIGPSYWWTAWSTPSIVTSTEMRQNYNNQILKNVTTMPQGTTNINNTINSMTPPAGAPLNNFGSAVVDGLLINHMKFSTTGL